MSQNVYKYPITVISPKNITYRSSPAHKGKLKYAVDFIVPEGTTIKAACSGTVVDVKQDSNKSGTDKSYDRLGNYIEIEHKYKEYSIYEHIQQKGLLVRVGDRVKVGQAIGFTGKTGWIAHLGLHLHFDVHTYFGNRDNDYRTIKIDWKKKKCKE